ncbi:MAG: zinc ribbon domain-containing protein [Spirochaetaceae bacterium]|nr:zinc ribbon domain-containing protein [Spirochaetaceae bacterium]
MPTYEYECKGCGHTFDVFQSMSDEPVKVCPQCGGEVRRLINGGSGIIFKGSGFYVTDKKGGAGGAAKPAASPPKAAEGSGPGETAAGGSSGPDKAAGTGTSPGAGAKTEAGGPAEKKAAG